MKTENQHTPGPWTAHKTEDGSARWTICHYGPLGYFGDIGGTDGQRTGEANANLAAAAPQLKRALEEIELQTTQARLASTIGKQKGKSEFLCNELERIGRFARDAIAAAECR